MSTEKALETLENVRQNIRSIFLTEGVKNRHSDFRTFTFCTSGSHQQDEQSYSEDMIQKKIITLHSNYYAEKIEQLKINNEVCCVFYSKEKKIQIRCFGNATINHGNEKSSHAWKNMSDMSKECYFQTPNPGSSISKYNDFQRVLKIKKARHSLPYMFKLKNLIGYFQKGKDTEEL